MAESKEVLNSASDAECPEEEAASAEALGYYSVECLPVTTSPDPRCRVELALKELSDLIRKEPTVPADPLQPDKPWAHALREDMAVQLPVKHCAFRACQYACAGDQELANHLTTTHKEELAKVVRTLPQHHAE